LNFPKNNQLIFRFLLLLFGIICGSTAIIFIKASTEQPLLVASYRLLIAGIVLFPFFLRDLSRLDGSYGWKQISWVLLPALALAFHLGSWVVGARMTQTANAVLIANLTPVAMPFFVWIFYREKINQRELFGTLLAMAGLIWMSGETFFISRSDFFGDLICFVSMLGFAMYLALGRKNGGRISLWLYMVPLYLIAGALCLVAACFFVNPLKEYTLTNALLILGLSIFPTVIGHTVLNFSLKFFRGQVVSVANLGQILFGTFFGFLAFGDVPRTSFYAAGVLIIIGILIVLQGSQQHQKQLK
jgi:drug/metabolite transporter (DMT)-like permease